MVCIFSMNLSWTNLGLILYRNIQVDPDKVYGRPDFFVSIISLTIIITLHGIRQQLTAVKFIVNMIVLAFTK